MVSKFASLESVWMQNI